METSYFRAPQSVRRVYGGILGKFADDFVRYLSKAG